MTASGAIPDRIALIWGKRVPLRYAVRQFANGWCKEDHGKSFSELFARDIRVLVSVLVS